MKELINELGMQDLSMKQKAIVWYFIISLCSLCITEDSQTWAIILIALNFVNAARLIRKVPLSQTEE